MHDGLDSHRACVVATEAEKQKKKHINFLLLAVHLILSSRGFWYVHCICNLLYNNLGFVVCNKL